jgi:hypothetical protein
MRRLNHVVMAPATPCLCWTLADHSSPCLLTHRRTSNFDAIKTEASPLTEHDDDIQFPNLNREELLSLLVPGDILHAVHHDGHGTPPCLVVSVEADTITTRSVTTQQLYVFDRRTGETFSGGNQHGATIKSVEPLPTEIHNTLLELDRKYRLGHRSSSSAKLTEGQKKALLFIADHYECHRI